MPYADKTKLPFGATTVPVKYVLSIADHYGEHKRTHLFEVADRPVISLDDHATFRMPTRVGWVLLALQLDQWKIGTQEATVELTTAEVDGIAEAERLRNEELANLRNPKPVEQRQFKMRLMPERRKW